MELLIGSVGPPPCGVLELWEAEEELPSLPLAACLGHWVWQGGQGRCEGSVPREPGEAPEAALARAGFERQFVLGGARYGHQAEVYRCGRLVPAEYFLLERLPGGGVEGTLVAHWYDLGVLLAQRVGPMIDFFVGACDAPASVRMDEDGGEGGE